MQRVQVRVTHGVVRHPAPKPQIQPQQGRNGLHGHLLIGWTPGSPGRVEGKAACPAFFGHKASQGGAYMAHTSTAQKPRACGALASSPLKEAHPSKQIGLLGPLHEARIPAKRASQDVGGLCRRSPCKCRDNAPVPARASPRQYPVPAATDHRMRAIACIQTLVHPQSAPRATSAAGVSPSGPPAI